MYIFIVDIGTSDGIKAAKAVLQDFKNRIVTRKFKKDRRCIQKFLESERGKQSIRTIDHVSYKG